MAALYANEPKNQKGRSLMSRNTPWRIASRQYALLQPGKNDWYRIRNQMAGPTQIHIYNEIGYFGVSASDFVRDLADVDGPLEVHLNSPGGEVFDGIAIYNALIARKNVTVVIDGIAASIASVIAMAGNPVLMARQSQVMIHEGFTMAAGSAQDFRDFAEQLDRTSNNIAEIYAEHTGRPAEYWRTLMQAETWFTAEEAIEAGLADRLLDSGAGRKVAPPNDTWDMSIYNKGGAALWVPRNATTHEPMTGTHTHNHSAFGQQNHVDGLHEHTHTHNGDNLHQHHYAWDPDGDGDDDSNPETDRDNSHWDFQGRQVLSVPGRPLDSSGNVIDITNASVDNSPWDAGRALANGANSDNPGSFYAGICAGRKAGDASKQGSWALPHHYHPGDAPNASGVRNALARFDSTQGLTNGSSAHSHLVSHMKVINPDYSPNDLAANGWIEPTDEDVAAFVGALARGGNAK
jgi:ATP-dependent protease ClpP protease subunit